MYVGGQMKGVGQLKGVGKLAEKVVLGVLEVERALSGWQHHSLLASFYARRRAATATPTRLAKNTTTETPPT